jgi:hypothetical protein
LVDAWSWVIDTFSHPLVLLTADSGSETDQVSETSLVYQPFAPGVPDMVGLMTGGVVSPDGQLTVIEAPMPLIQWPLL